MKSVKILKEFRDLSLWLYDNVTTISLTFMPDTRSITVFNHVEEPYSIATIYPLLSVEGCEKELQKLKDFIQRFQVCKQCGIDTHVLFDGLCSRCEDKRVDTEIDTENRNNTADFVV